MIRELSAGGVVVSRVRGRPCVAVVRVRDRSGSVEDHDHEVEEALWIPLAEAPERLAYKGEREMAATAMSRVEKGR